MSSSYEETAKSITQLTKVADAVLALAPAETELFVAELLPYLDAFETWRATLEGENGLSRFSDTEQAALKIQLLQLNELHSAIVVRAEQSRDIIAELIGDVHKKSKAIKQYVDHFPPRISITSKKQG